MSVRNIFVFVVFLSIILVSFLFIGFYGFDRLSDNDSGLVNDNANDTDLIPAPDSIAQTNLVLNNYLTEYSVEDFSYTYSGLTEEELTQVNNIISLSRQNIFYKEEQKKLATDIYRRLFELEASDRIQDAPSSRANYLMASKLCVARAIILSEEPDTVKKCLGKDDYPSDISWTTDDITAEAQISPYYLVGSYYNDNTEDVARARYYLNQVLTHYETGLEQWGKEYYEGIVSEDYFNMVNDTRQKLKILN